MDWTNKTSPTTSVTYGFMCEGCGKPFDAVKLVLQRDDPEPCPLCGSLETERVVGMIAGVHGFDVGTAVMGPAAVKMGQEAQAYYEKEIAKNPDYAERLTAANMRTAPFKPQNRCKYGPGLLVD